MHRTRSSPLLLRSRGRRLAVGAVALTLLLPACGGGPSSVPTPRPLVIRSGARLFPEKERLQKIDAWFRPQLDNIERDPSFLIETVTRDTPAYPWESLLIQGDTARIALEATSPEARIPYMIYAHFHLMKAMGHLERWLPEAAQAEGFELERAIVVRVADVWLYGRSAWDAQAYDPLEELIYAAEGGYLEAMLLTARGEEFREEREAWLREDPEGLETYRRWFVETFDREPPGLRANGL